MIALLLSALYLTWRTAFTLNMEAWWLSLPLLVLEMHAVAGLALFTFSLWDLDGAQPAAVVDGTSQRVAVLIPTYNEPAEVVLPTIAAAVALQPAHETWVLDDGDRPEIAELAQALGASYLARGDNRDAKAGNLNHALATIDADLVAILDADHVADADFLRHTLGYFADPAVAVVQTPQDFYNPESFEHVRVRSGWGDRHSRAIYSEQSLFYRAIQAGKNRWHAAFWCGTGAVLRVAALDSVGGVATGSVTEDIQTSLRLQRRGWKVVYHNEVLARGLAAATVDQYALQRHRWCTGAMQVLRSERPLTGPGLSLQQRLCYGATLLGWFDAWRTLGYLLLPPLVLLTGANPIRSHWMTFLTLFAVTFVLQQVALWRLGRGYGHPVPALVFELVRMTPTLRATTSLVLPRAPKFRVTPKGRTDDGRGRAPVPGLLATSLVLALVCAGWYFATLAGSTPLAYATPWVAHGAFLWLVVNACMTVAAIRRVRAPRYAGERRASVRFPVQATALVQGRGCELLDVSLTGVRLLAPADIGGGGLDQPPAALLQLPAGLPPYRCTVRERTWVSDATVRLGLEIHASPVERAALALWLFGLPGASPQLKGPDATADEALARLLSTAGSAHDDQPTKEMML